MRPSFFELAQFLESPSKNYANRRRLRTQLECKLIDTSYCNLPGRQFSRIHQFRTASEPGYRPNLGCREFAYLKCYSKQCQVAFELFPVSTVLGKPKQGLCQLEKSQNATQTRRLRYHPEHTLLPLYILFTKIYEFQLQIQGLPPDLEDLKFHILECYSKECQINSRYNCVRVFSSWHSLWIAQAKTLPTGEDSERNANTTLALSS